MARTPSASLKTAHSALRAWAVAGALLGTLWATVAWAPARWLALAVAQASQGQVLLQAARGTVWQGSAQLVFSGGQGSQGAQALPGRFKWDIWPDGLGLALALQTDCCMPETTTLRWQAGLGQWAVQVSDHRSQWPASLLSGLGAPWNTLQPEGQLQLRTQALQWQWSEGRLQWQGLAELTAQDMSTRLSTLRPMGSYQLQVQAPSGGSASPQVQLSTLSGPLQLTGQGQWLGQHLRFTGEAFAAPEQEEALSNLLNIIGRRQGTRSQLSFG